MLRKTEGERDRQRERERKEREGEREYVCVCRWGERKCVRGGIYLARVTSL